MIPATPSTSLEILYPHPDHTILRVTGCDTINEDNADTVGQKLSLLPDAVAGGHVVLDLREVRYMTSTALGTLVSFNRRVRSAGGRLALANVGAIVLEILAVTRLNQLLEVWPA